MGHLPRVPHPWEGAAAETRTQAVCLQKSSEDPWVPPPELTRSRRDAARIQPPRYLLEISCPLYLHLSCFGLCVHYRPSHNKL